MNIELHAANQSAIRVPHLTYLSIPTMNSRPTYCHFLVTSLLERKRYKKLLWLKAGLGSAHLIRLASQHRVKYTL